MRDSIAIAVTTNRGGIASSSPSTMNRPAWSSHAPSRLCVGRAHMIRPAHPDLFGRRPPSDFTWFALVGGQFSATQAAKSQLILPITNSFRLLINPRLPINRAAAKHPPSSVSKSGDRRPLGFCFPCSDLSRQDTSHTGRK